MYLICSVDVDISLIISLTSMVSSEMNRIKREVKKEDRVYLFLLINKCRCSRTFEHPDNSNRDVKSKSAGGTGK